MKPRSASFTLIFTVMFGVSAFAADDPWHVLKEVTHRRCIGVMYKGGPTCVSAEIKHVSDDGMTLAPCSLEKVPPVTLARKDVLRVSYDEHFLFSLGETLYSARSSWTDVMSVAAVVGKSVQFINQNGKQLDGLIFSIDDGHSPHVDNPAIKVRSGNLDVVTEIKHIIRVEGVPGEYESRIRVTTKDGKKHEGRIQHVSPDEITLTAAYRKNFPDNDKVEHGKKADVAILRADVQRIELIQDRPPSDSLSFWGSEMGGAVYVNPESWLYEIQRGAKLGVRLYDASMPQDNTPLGCRE